MHKINLKINVGDEDNTELLQRIMIMNTVYFWSKRQMAACNILGLPEWKKKNYA